MRTSVNATVTVAPDYSCGPHAFAFMGENGLPGEAGGNGPDVTVRIGIVPSPFYDRLLVAGVQVGVAPPFYVLADADWVAPADWLRIITQGGRGGEGAAGTAGLNGADGEPGCPGSPGGGTFLT